MRTILPKSIVSALRARILIATPDQASTPQDDFSLIKDQIDDTRHNAASDVPLAQGQNDQISAADYDPSQDRREEEMRRIKAIDAQDEHKMDVDDALVEEVEEEVDDDDDVDDMFAAIQDTPKPKKVRLTVHEITVDSRHSREGSQG